ncbi:MAG: bacteriocin family protein [Synergistaceae bacterium]|jgi:uncharacterized linocin/CFP29 family protein|nr:bacteriocin family protein [Synergistaceae bacterium]
MGSFGRSHVPISAAALKQIDEQAARTLRANLAARKFVDVKGPYGWEYSSVPVGRSAQFQKSDGVGYGVRLSIPLVEFQVTFELDSLELHNIDRGSSDPDLTPVERAARTAAAFEDKVVFHGFEHASIKGLACECVNAAAELPTDDDDAFILAITDAINKMKTEDSITGPYALVGGKKLQDSLGRITGGRSLYEVIKKNTELDEFIRTQSPDDAFLVSKRGGDFELTLGGDFTVGYISREDNTLKFFLAESFAFRVLEPRAYLPLKLK